MKFSILVPTLNEERYVGRLLDSLVNQTHTDFEIVVVDAQSDDKTVDVVKKYHKRLNLKVISSKQRNISYQRNLAAKSAVSDHLIFFDADVIVETRFLEKVHTFLNQNKIQFASSWVLPMSRRLIDRIIFGLFNRLYLELAKHLVPGGAGAFLYVHKKAFGAVKGFDTSTNFGEDFDLVKRLHRLGFKYHLFRDPAIEFSVRRLDREGRLFFIYKMLRSGIYYHLHGTIHDPRVFMKNEFGKF